MMRPAFALLAVLGVATTSPAQDWAKTKLEKSPRHGEWVTITHGDRNVQAFVVYPEIKHKATAVLVVHEIFGLSDWVRLCADELAEAGYIAIAPDLLSGMGKDGGGTDTLGESVRKTILALPPDQITADLTAAADYVAKLPAANGKVAVAGFCWGGGQAFRFATNNKNLSAALVFYGPGPAEVADITAPVYGFYGENDARVNATLPATTKAMQAADKTFEPVTYDGAGHGFFRAGAAPDATQANKKARADAWTRLKTILGKLPPNQP